MTLPRTSAALLAAAAALALAGFVQAQTISEFPLAPRSSPAGITAGPDGNVWFVEEHGDRVGRISPSGVLAEFPLRNAGSFARGITAGPDGALWFTELPGRIGRVTTSGSISEIDIPIRPAEPAGIVKGSDGNLWFADYYERIGRLTPSGALTYFTLAAGVGLRGIASGPDGAIWFALSNVGRIGKLTPAGALTQFQLPDAGSGPFGITAGADGNLWFTEYSTSRIGRLSPAGALTEFPLAGGAAPYGITAGSDGNIWFTEYSLDRVARITPAGAITEFAIPTPGGSPAEIAAGPDGNVWFTEFNGDRIGRISLHPSCTPDATTLCLNGARFEVRVAWAVPSQGSAGQAAAMALTGDTGAYWFFTANNIELLVKVVDGRSFNGKFWVFAGALTDVRYTLTVRDVQTGAVRVYEHPAGVLESLADTAAF
jgi:streptogramin lyase